MITLFGSASTPADNGTNTADPTAVTPPSNMQQGDLVFVWTSARATAGTLQISQAGGQAWTSLTQRNQSNCRSRGYWCVFNGTWSANPSFAFGAATCNIVRMLVFRPNGGTSSIWQVDVAESSGTYSAPANPYTVTITGITTQMNGALVIAAWSSADDNTWGSLTAGWTALSPAQVRNTSGSDQSVTNAWLIKSPAGATGNVAQNQATLGGDAGCYLIMAFKEIASQAIVNTGIGGGEAFGGAKLNFTIRK